VGPAGVPLVPDGQQDPDGQRWRCPRTGRTYRQHDDVLVEEPA
jgi:hypothetical protein